MQMFVKKRIGKNTLSFAVTGDNLLECAMEAEKLAFRDVYKCGVCESEYLYLKAYRTKPNDAGKQYDYVKVICAKCRASVTFGHREDDRNIMFLRSSDGKLKWEEYHAPEQQPTGQSYNSGGDTHDDLPDGF